MKNFIKSKIKNRLEFIFKLNDLFERKERIQFIFVVLATLLMAFFQALGIASILPFIDMVMDPEIIDTNSKLNFFYNYFQFKAKSSFIIASGLVVLGLLIIGNFVSAFATWMKINFVWKKNHSLSTALLRKYISMPYTFFLKNNSSDLGKNVLAEVQQLTSGFLMPITKIITNSLVVFIVFAMLLTINPSITFGVILILALSYTLIYLYFSKKLKQGGKQRLKENTDRYKVAGEALGGIKDIKVLGVESIFLNKFLRHSKTFSNLQSWYKVIGEIPRYVMEVVAFGGIILILIFLVSSQLPAQKIIPLISFFAFAGYRLMPSLQEIFSSFTNLKFNEAILNQIHNDMCCSDDTGVQKDFTDRKSLKPIKFGNEIELSNISFTYPGKEKEVLKDINITIKKNNFVAIIGETGAGKTTLVDLILGLLTPNRGTMKVDNTEITTENIRNWQANLGYVPQQIYLSDDTIAKNIAFGLTDERIDLKRVKEVARLANLDSFIEEDLSRGYNTKIGERGIKLSGGQKQRIGIARALYHDPEVLLLDEATSSLDDKTEKEVLKAIESVAKLKTMIVIAHRLTTIKNSDLVYVIKKGKVSDKGTYKTIISKITHK
jgi:ATP-binding cassette subfamily C protein